MRDDAVNNLDPHPLSESDQAEPASVKSVAGKGKLGAVIEQHGALTGDGVEPTHGCLHVVEPIRSPTGGRTGARARG